MMVLLKNLVISPWEDSSVGCSYYWIKYGFTYAHITGMHET